MSDKPHVLLAEDDDDLRNVYRMILEAQGFRVSLAGDGMTALRLAHDEDDPPDCIVLDYHMPGELDGLQTWEKLKQHPRTADIPIAIHSNDDRPAKAALMPLIWMLKARFDPTGYGDQIRTMIANRYREKNREQREA